MTICFETMIMHLNNLALFIPIYMINFFILSSELNTALMS